MTGKTIHRSGEGTPARGLVSRAIFLFGGANSLLFFINGRPYLSFPSAGRLEAVFRYTAFFAHFLLVALVLAGALGALYVLLRSGRLVKVLSVFLFSLAQVFIFVDVRVYTHFKFHLSGIVLSAMTTPGYWDSVRFSARDRIFSILAVIILLAAEFALFNRFRNAIHYADHNLGRILVALEEPPRHPGYHPRYPG